MTNIVIPVKHPSAAKQRLNGVLSAGQRTELALAVFEHMLSVVLPAGSAPPAPQVPASPTPARDYGVLVVTDSKEIETAAAARGASVLLEKTAGGETSAVEAATRWSCENGFDRQIVLPADLPCIAREDIDTLVSLQMDPPAVILCPATGDDGTNAILTSPPDVLAFRFGKASFPDYLDQASRRGISCRVIRMPRLVLDLDTPEDLRTFLEEPKDSVPFRLVSGWDLRFPNACAS